MLVTFEIEERFSTTTAPLGAAAYCVTRRNADTVVIIFAMMSADDASAAATLRRVIALNTPLNWAPCMSQPARYRAPYISEMPFVEYIFTRIGDVWSPASLELANFLAAAATGMGLAGQAPASLGAKSPVVPNK
jgi:hypothetical protein